MRIQPVKTIRRKRNKGFLLLEALLGFMIFSTAVVGILIAINKAAELSEEVRREHWAMQQARNIVIEVATMSPPEGSGGEFAREEFRILDESAEARILVTPFEIENQEQETLEDLYEINVTIRWEIGSGKWKEVEHRLIHHSKLFEPNAGGRRSQGGMRR